MGREHAAQEYVEQDKRRCGRLGSGRRRSGREQRDGQKIETLRVALVFVGGSLL